MTQFGLSKRNLQKCDFHIVQNVYPLNPPSSQ